MASFIDDEVFVQCPYDKSHQILNYRFQTHLIKCSKNHIDKKLIVCPFNSTHLYSKKDLPQHVKSCPNRASFELYTVNLNATENVKTNDDRNKIIQPQIMEDTNEENWDDVNEPTYNPTAYAENAPVLRNIYGAKPSERKAFRSTERMRLNKLNNGK